MCISPSYSVSIHSKLSFMLVFYLFSIIISIAVSFYSDDNNRNVSYILGSLTIISFISSPLAIGYHFLGTGDPLTHLGIVKEFMMSDNNIATYFYPGLHTISTYIALLSNVEVNISSYITLIAFVIIYVLYMYLYGRLFSDNCIYLNVLFFSVCLLLPVNNIACKLMFYPTIAIALSTPVVFYLLFKVIYCADYRVTGYALSLTLFTFFFIMLHPLLALVVSLSLFIPSILISLINNPGHFDRYNLPHINNDIFLSKYIVLFVVSTIFWIIYNANLALKIKSHTSHFFQTLIYQVRDVFHQYSAVSESSGVAELSLFEIVTKEFIISWIYIILTCLVIYLLIMRKRSTLLDGKMHITIQLTAFLLIFLILIFYFISGSMRFSFRYYGFLMMPITIIGSIALFDLISQYKKYSSLIIVFFVVCYLFTYITIFPSPYIYDTNDLISESMIHGANTFFDKKDELIHVSSFFVKAYRLGDAIYGPSIRIKKGIPFLTGSEDQTNKYVVPEHFANQKLIEQYNNNSLISDHLYIMLTISDIELNKIRNYYKFSHDDFVWFNNCTNISKVYSNPSITFYYVSV